MIYQSFKMAVKAIAGNKMRSFLTILGVVIGVVAIVVLVSIGQGANSSVVESIEGMGTNLITANEYYLSYDYFIRKLVIGRISENLLLYNENEKVYTIADRINLRPILECESFVAFLKIFYDHALPPNER